ncbi:uncharacterized protein ANIA_11434 [Aspergillus nidulans FGSC A4]|uniref:Uncharacterized protein n=1 Tax=Emericella nidulans (strain FGSC A4 / ATCC 38163 / CBS 112.46 / NRRL 194 / M139) TaxID=227321 RepID=C8V977_EMENI|nr:hypothetical protein [Aspergillus nidulans FGSC A4]CBF77779.1 TPA: hypothetical protein ANIA_11434 [Aspergillus nidulans FGSC A4]
MSSELLDSPYATQQMRRLKSTSPTAIDAFDKAPPRCQTTTADSMPLFGIDMFLQLKGLNTQA